MKASELPEEQQEQVRNILQHKIIERLVNDIMANPPDIDLEGVEIVLGPKENAANVDIKNLRWYASGGCETCSAIGGGGGCETCSAIG